MVLWIDAKILLDVLQKRIPHYHKSALIWKLCETRQVTGYVSVLTLANIVYVMRKELSPEKIEQVLSAMALIFTFEDFRSEDIQKASMMHWHDFEDAVQFCGASRIHADYVITRNPDNFKASSIPALLPEEFLSDFLNT